MQTGSASPLPGLAELRLSLAGPEHKAPVPDPAAVRGVRAARGAGGCAAAGGGAAAAGGREQLPEQNESFWEEMGLINNKTVVLTTDAFQVR